MPCCRGRPGAPTSHGRPRRWARLAARLALVAAALAAPQRASAQTPSHAFGWTVRVERWTEHYQYRFENPTTFDSPQPVPHFFEQRYDAGNTWLLVAATYRLAGARARTEAGFTPSRHTAGSDIDTFFLPTGDVATSGTNGTVSLYSLRVGERLTLATWRGIDLGVVVEYRRSRANFLPDDRIVTHSQPPSERREFTTDRETTISHVFGSGLTADASLPAGGGWRLALGADLLPAVRGWLVTKLPDKYPGQDIVAEALNFGARVRVSIEHCWTHVAMGVRAAARGVWPYHRSARYRERGAAAGMFVTVGGN